MTRATGTRRGYWSARSGSEQTHDRVSLGRFDGRDVLADGRSLVLAGGDDIGPDALHDVSEIVAKVERVGRHTPTRRRVAVLSIGKLVSARYYLDSVANTNGTQSCS